MLEYSMEDPFPFLGIPTLNYPHLSCGDADL
jgi:hypothetical protein